MIDNKKIKILAFHLPQFHAIPENDEWWGAGFTEWTNVKKAKPIFKNQYQPREPLNDFYYDLSDINTLKWQADLAKKYNVYGFCFYHYWFNGKLLLEKPVENLLRHSEIDVNYCFSWANEPWTRTWDGLDNHVLMPQFYGQEADWEKHINYLLPFFKDERYIKIDNKPMFLIYKPESIDDCEKMMMHWHIIAKKNGFNGIHFVETLRGQIDERKLPFDAGVEFEPFRTIRRNSFWGLKLRALRMRSFRLINKLFRTQLPLRKKMLFRKIAQKSLGNISHKNAYGGVFVGWDNTPRKGNESIYISEPLKSEFEHYLKEKIKITKTVYKTEFIFVNAWNEWCEGTYLEPDKKHKFEYLEVIKKVLDEE